MSNEKEALDGELYIGDNKPPISTSREVESEEGLWGEPPNYQILDFRGINESLVYDRVLGKWKDPTSPL